MRAPALSPERRPSESANRPSHRRPTVFDAARAECPGRWCTCCGLARTFGPSLRDRASGSTRSSSLLAGSIAAVSSLSNRCSTSPHGELRLRAHAGRRERRRASQLSLSRPRLHSLYGNTTALCDLSWLSAASPGRGIVFAVSLRVERLRSCGVKKDMNLVKSESFRSQHNHITPHCVFSRKWFITAWTKRWKM